MTGIIGPEYSSEAEVMSQLLRAVRPEKQLVQVGYSTTASVLTTGDKYPNFVRVIPNDDIQVEVSKSYFKLYFILRIMFMLNYLHVYLYSLLDLEIN